MGAESDRGNSAAGALRVVLDTNVAVSAVVFPGMAWLRQAWRSAALEPLGSSATVGEFLRVLSYPKFGLDRWEQEVLASDYLAHIHPVTVVGACSLKCRDVDDQKFLDLTASAQPAALATGDRDLLALAPRAPWPIWTPAQLRQRLEG